MPILGHGIDIVETARIRQLVESHGQRFLDRCFTPGELAYCNRNTKRFYEHLAGRFAAKEAVLKVLGTGWRGGIQWTDIEILREPSGQPRSSSVASAAASPSGSVSAGGMSASATSRPTQRQVPSAWRRGKKQTPINSRVYVAVMVAAL